MDRPSDLIEGAILSGRYEEPKGKLAGNCFRLSPKFKYEVSGEIKAKRDLYGLCPLQIAQLELGEAVTLGSVAGRKLGLEWGVISRVMQGADKHNSNGIDILRQEGF